MFIVRPLCTQAVIDVWDKKEKQRAGRNAIIMEN